MPAQCRLHMCGHTAGESQQWSIPPGVPEEHISAHNKLEPIRSGPQDPPGELLADKDAAQMADHKAKCQDAKQGSATDKRLRRWEQFE